MSSIESTLVISKQALERVKKDKFIRENKKWYERQIFLIKTAPSERPTERIGEFNITPRGREMKRIAWHFEMINNILWIYIDDLLYHISNENYVDRWNMKARNGEIVKTNYGPYLPFEGLI